MLELKNVCKGFSKEHSVLDGVSYTFDKGKVYGLMGPNGSGKTVLLKTVCGLFDPDEGQVLWDGSALKYGAKGSPRFGALIEEPKFYLLESAFENLSYLQRMLGQDNPHVIYETLSRVGLNPTLRKKFMFFSLGMKQKLGIAAAILNFPDILILDEPTNALDASALELLSRVVREERDRGAVVLIASHSKKFLNDNADYVVRLREGRLHEAQI